MGNLVSKFAQHAPVLGGSDGTEAIEALQLFGKGCALGKRLPFQDEQTGKHALTQRVLELDEAVCELIEQPALFGGEARNGLSDE